MNFVQNRAMNFTILVVWCVWVVAGFWKLFEYVNTPGAESKASVNWPSSSGLPRDSHLSTLLIFLHPRCPCSAATIGELERLIPHVKEKIKIVAVFLQPHHKTADWVTHENLWKKVNAIPGVEAVLDDNGVETAHFDVKTSGQTLLYNPDGVLVFRGGITPERGHMGDSAGRKSILQFLSAETVSVHSTPVFGCSILNPERAVAGAK